MNKYVKDYINGLSGREISKKYKASMYKVYKNLSGSKEALFIELMKINEQIDGAIDYSKISPRELLKYKIRIMELLLKYSDENIPDDRNFNVIIVDSEKTKEKKSKE